MPGFGFGPYAGRPYMSIISRPLPSATLAAPDPVNIYIAEIVLASGTAYRFATEEWATKPTDSRPSISFDGTMAKAPSFKRSIKSGGGFGGMSSGFGPLDVNNASGEYDPLLTVPTDGALVTVGIVQRGGSYDSGVVIFTGVVDGKPTCDGDVLSISFKDDNKRLEIPAQRVYGGTGGIDGDSNAKGKNIPICLGTPLNVTLQLIDATNLVYQGHDGRMTGWSHIYDRGVEVTANSIPDYASYAALIVPSAVAAGRWASCNVLGIIRFGAKPDGLVTGTPSGGAVSNGMVAGSPTIGTALTDTASLVHWVITNAGASVVVDTASVLAVKTAQPAAIQYFLSSSDSKTIRQVADDLMRGIGGHGGFKADRSFGIGVFGLPTGAVVGDFTQMDWYDEARFVPLPDEYAVPPRRVLAAYGRNFTQQADIDATVDASTQTLRKDSYSVAVSSDTVTSAAIAASYPNSTDSEVVNSWFALSADAVAFCNAQLALKGGAPRCLIRVNLTEVGFGVDVGAVMRLTDSSLTPRFGLNVPKSLTVVEIDNGFDDGEIAVEGFGAA